MKTVRYLIQPTCKIIHLQIKKRITHFPIRKSFIQTVQDTIEVNINDENFGIKELCKAICLSRSQLHNKIKAKTGLSTSIYIRSIRLKKAKYLLENTDFNVSEVAYEVGFKDPSYFSRLYSNKYGITPNKVSQSIRSIR